MANPQKPVPPSFGIKNLLKLFPPALDYTYFSGRDEYPFKADATVHNTANAWWLAECSLLAYESENTVRKVLSEAGDFQEDTFQWIESRETDTQGFIIEAIDFAVISLRGTEFYRPDEIIQNPLKLLRMARDLLLDAQLQLNTHTQKTPVFDTSVHSGFYCALNSIWSQIQRPINGLPSSKSLWLTGHSLGAAISTLLAHQFATRIAGLYTYGSPCVGGLEFADAFDQKGLNQKTFRYLHGNDFVAKVLENWNQRAPSQRYAHVGTLKTLDTKQRKTFLETLWNRLVALDQTDHAPIYYAIQAWNVIP